MHKCKTIRDQPHGHATVTAGAGQAILSGLCNIRHNDETKHTTSNAVSTATSDKRDAKRFISGIIKVISQHAHLPHDKTEYTTLHTVGFISNTAQRLCTCRQASEPTHATTQIGGSPQLLFTVALPVQVCRTTPTAPQLKHRKRTKRTHGRHDTEQPAARYLIHLLLLLLAKHVIRTARTMSQSKCPENPSSKDKTLQMMMPDAQTDTDALLPILMCIHHHLALLYLPTGRTCHAPQYTVHHLLGSSAGGTQPLRDHSHHDHHHTDMQERP